MLNMEIESNAPRSTLLPIGSLKPYSRGLRVHNGKQRKKLDRLLRRFGQVAPIIVDANHTIIDGHAVWEAMQQLGYDEVAAVIVSGRTDPELKALRVALNRIPHDAGWDDDQLRAEFQELMSLSFDLDLTGFEAVEIDNVLDIDIAGSNIVEDGSSIPEPLGPAVSQKGDIWICGPHRVGCGDALDENFVRLVLGNTKPCISFIDPPFNLPILGFVSGKGTTTHREFVQGSGEMSEPEFIAFAGSALRVVSGTLSDGDLIFACMDWRHLFELLTAAREARLHLLNICVWAKTNAGMGSLYRSQHELVCVLKAGSGPHRNNVELGKSGRHRSNLWTYRGMNSFAADRDDLLKLHPTVKPVSMIADAIRDVTKRGEAVIDTFLGSGSTLIAAEQTGRVCLAVELDPLYVDVAVKRWQQTTKRDAVLADSEETFDERSQCVSAKIVEAVHG